jgi:DNA (cytosine-5)-methyltransferase 1
VFVVASARDDFDPAAVLFEFEGLRRDIAPSREKGQSVAGSTIPSVAGSLDTECGGGKLTHQSVANGHIVPAKPQWWDGGDLAATITTKSDDQRMPDKANAQLVMQPVFEMHGQDSRVRDLGDTCSTVTSKWGTGGGNVPVALQPIALAENTIGRQPHNGGNGDGFTDGGPMYTLNATGVHGVAQPIPFGVSEKPDVGHCLRSGASRADKHESTTYVAQPMAFDLAQITSAVNMTRVDPSLPVSTMSKGSDMHVASTMAVRRLTPVECERLQGFPDGYTDIKPSGKPTPDGPRYKALGNSWAVPVVRWIGERIARAIP